MTWAIPPREFCITDLSYSYGDFSVLSDVSIVLRPGEVTALLGANGAGKSTLLGCIAGTHRVKVGSMTLCGTPYRPASVADARRQGVLSMRQEIDVFPDLTVGRNRALLSLSADKRHQTTRDDDRRLMRNLPAREQREAMIEAALHSKASAFLFDEPTDLLNRERSDAFYALLRIGPARKSVVLLITHKREDFHGIDRWIYLEGGRVALDTRSKKESEGAFDRLLSDQTLVQAATPSRLPVDDDERRGWRSPPKPALVRANCAARVRAFLADERWALWAIPAPRDADLAGIIEATLAAEALSAPREFAYLAPDRQGDMLFPDLSRYDHARCWLGVQHSSSDAWERLETLLPAFGISPTLEWWQQPARRLSGGTLQKFLTALVLSRQARCHILCHPDRGLDAVALGTLTRAVKLQVDKGDRFLLYTTSHALLALEQDRQKCPTALSSPDDVGTAD